MRRKKLFDEIPYIESGRLVLKRIEDTDADVLDEMRKDTEVGRYLPSFLLESQFDDVHDVIRQMYGDAYQNKESLYLGIYIKPEMDFCGIWEFYGFRDHIHKVSVGCRLRRKYWDRGIASEAVKLAVKYLYEETDTEIITASTMIENSGSAKVLAGCGFKKVSSSVPEDWGFEGGTAADKWIY